MHLVFLNQYYPPDAAPTGAMLEGLVEELARDGHQVTVLCAAGSGYAEEGTSHIEQRTSNCGTKKREMEFGIRSVIHSSPEPSTLNSQAIHIIRLRASRFGRGTFVGKVLDYASYYGRVAWKLLTLRPAPDRIVALTTPPLLSVLARMLSKIRGADHAHWVMDLYPDVMAAHGMLGETSAAYRILAGLARWGFGGGRCAAVLTLGPDMAERVARVMGREGRSGAGSQMARGNPCASSSDAFSQPSTLNSQFSSIHWVPLWATGEVKLNDEALKSERERDEFDSPSTLDQQPASSSTTLRHQRGWADAELIVMYSGNMGLGHCFSEVLAAAGRLKIERRGKGVADFVDFSQRGTNESRDESRGSLMPASNHQPSDINHQLSSIRFVFFGGGKRRVEVEAFVRADPDAGVEVGDYAPAVELVAHLQSADVHLVSLVPAWTGAMVPSKLQGIFAAGRPVIFIGSAESSIGRWVAESGGGWLVQPDDVEGLLAVLDEARDPKARLTRGRAAKDFAEKYFDKRTNVARVAAILARSL